MAPQWAPPGVKVAARADPEGVELSRTLFAFMRFAKLQGLGNDFIVVDSAAVPPDAISGLARQLCDRRFGVGADGLLLWQRHSTSNPAVFRMRIFNADGGEAELSGNGLRCLAAYLYHQGTVTHDEVQIDTLAGRKRLRLVRKTGLEYWFDVEMGRPILDRKQIAFRPAGRAILTDRLASFR